MKIYKVIDKIKKMLIFFIGIIFIFSYKNITNFFTLRKSYSIQYYSLMKYVESINLDFYPVGTYEWGNWRRELGKKFSKKLPIGFLHNHLISGTMVLGSSEHQEEKLKIIENHIPKKVTEIMLKEDIVGIPVISNLHYLTSENCIHQAFHLAAYKKNTNQDIYNSREIIEWGGGYGCLAKIVKKVNPNCTYTILDLPELSSLQYVYLSSIFGKEMINFITSNLKIEKGKINLVSSDHFMYLNEKINCDAFISNWALTESGKDYQNFVVSKNFFNAEKVLIGCINDENNFLIDNLNYEFKFKKSIEVLGPENYYLGN